MASRQSGQHTLPSSSQVISPPGQHSPQMSQGIISASSNSYGISVSPPVGLESAVVHYHRLEVVLQAEGEGTAAPAWRVVDPPFVGERVLFLPSLLSGSGQRFRHPGGAGGPLGLHAVPLLGAEEGVQPSVGGVPEESVQVDTLGAHELDVGAADPFVYVGAQRYGLHAFLAPDVVVYVDEGVFAEVAGVGDEVSECVHGVVRLITAANISQTNRNNYSVRYICC